MAIPRRISRLLFFLINVLPLLRAESSGPQIQLTPESVSTSVIGESLAITCQTTDEGGVDTPKWYIRHADGDKKVANSDRISTTSGKKASLVFSNTTRSDDGLYVCKVERDGQSFEKTINLALHDPITFVDAKTNQHPVVGSEASIVCKVQHAEVSWLKDHVQIEEGGDRNYRLDDDSQQLVIPDFTQADDGDYVCKAIQTETGRMRLQTITVQGHVGPEITQFEDVQVNEGGDAQMTCLATGFPQPTFKWFKDGSTEPLVGGGSNDKVSFPENGVLKIKDVSKIDNGSYMCTAENAVGSKSQSAVLKVFLKPTIEGSEKELTVVADKGTDKTIDCLFTGEQTETTWKHGTMVYHQGGGDSKMSFVEEPSGDKTNLAMRLTDLDLSNAGEYRCVASNPAGTAELVVKLEISHPPQMKQFTPANKKSAIGKPLEITCDVEAVPAPNKWLWYRGGESLNDNSHFQITQTDNNLKSTLKVDSMESEDFGIYKCEADNGHGSPADFSVDVMRVVTPDLPEELVNELTEPEPDYILFSVRNYNGDLLEPNRPENLLVQVVKSTPPASEGDEGEPQLAKTCAEESWVDVGQNNVSFKDWKIHYGHLEPSSEYCVRVAGMNLAGVSDWFVSPDTFKTSAPKKPSSPVVSDAGTPVVCTSYPCSIKWSQPNDNGAAITDYRIKHRKIADYDGTTPGAPLNDWSDVSTVSADKFLGELHDLDPNSYYEVELIARNEAGDSAPTITYVRTGPGQTTAGGPGTGAVVAIVIILILIILVVIDVSCYYMNRCGLLMCICTSCGRPDSGKEKMVTMEEGKPTKTTEDKQPLKDMHEGEKEPEEKPEANEDTPMIVTTKQSDVKNSSV